jgi:hypothetical protein
MNTHLSLFASLATALQKFTNSASMYVTGDCMLHATLAHAILSEHGIATRIVVGVAAWRCGPGDGDVIIHVPSPNQISPHGVKAFAYHTWLELGDSLLDFTTHSLRQKAARLDAADGGKTLVSWCPSYLYLEKSRIKTFRDVVNAADSGVAFYQEVHGLHEMLKSKGYASDCSPDDLSVLRLIMQNPTIRVTGLNDLGLGHQSNQLVCA